MAALGEIKRYDGYRKVGGIYLCARRVEYACHRLPIPLKVCPTCNCGFKQTRNWTWIDRVALIGKCEDEYCYTNGNHIGMNHERNRGGLNCRVCNLHEKKAGLLWVGSHFYTTDGFLAESALFGVSKRIPAVPHGFKLEDTVVFLAHPEVEFTDEGKLFNGKISPGIFCYFIPESIEMIITQRQSGQQDLMRSLKVRGIHPVIVDDEDDDHRGSAYIVKKKSMTTSSRNTTLV